MIKPSYSGVHAFKHNTKKTFFFLNSGPIVIRDSKFGRKAEKTKALELLCSYDIPTTGYIFFFFKEHLCKHTAAIIRRKLVPKTGKDQCLGKKFRSKEI